MNDVLERLSRVDLDTAIRNLLGFLDTVDPCFLGLIVGVLVFIGSRMVSGQAVLQSWGLRFAVATSLGYAGYLWLAGKYEEGTPTWKLGVRCVGVGGIVLAISWIVLPVLSFVHRRFRLALAVFLGYGTYTILTTEDFTAEQLPTAALYALLAASLALIVAWIVDPIWNAFSRHLIPAKPLQERPVEAPPPSVPLRPAFFSSTPTLLGRVEDGQDAQRRRDRARMQLELAYLQAMPGIGAWMPRHLFDDFLRRHLADTLPPEDVEENARQLLRVFQQHQEQVQDRSEFTSFDELAGWLLAEQQRIQALALDQPLKQTQLLDLHQRYLLLATRMVQRQAPHGLTAV